MLHGAADTVVRPSNADHIIRQWLDVQKLPERASGEEQIGRHTHRVWEDANGEPQLEAYSIAGMGHGVPLATAGADGYGAAGPFFLEAGINSTVRIACFWGLDSAAAGKRKAWMQPAGGHIPGEAQPSLHRALAHDAATAGALRMENHAFAHVGALAADPATVIEAAFKVAGLPGAGTHRRAHNRSCRHNLSGAEGGRTQTHLSLLTKSGSRRRQGSPTNPLWKSTASTPQAYLIRAELVPRERGAHAHGRARTICNSGCDRPGNSS